MGLNKRQLSEKLQVSETSLTAWQREGMPVLVPGARGKPGTYDLAAVARWIKQAGKEIHARTGAPVVDLAALERELAGTPLAQSAAPPRAPTFPDPRTIRAIELARGSSLLRACALATRLLGITPEQALKCSEIFSWELTNAFQDVHGWETGPVRVAADEKAILAIGGRIWAVGEIEKRAACLDMSTHAYEHFDEYFVDDDL